MIGRSPTQTPTHSPAVWITITVPIIETVPRAIEWIVITHARLIIIKTVKTPGVFAIRVIIVLRIFLIIGLRLGLLHHHSLGIPPVYIIGIGSSYCGTRPQYEHAA